MDRRDLKPVLALMEETCDELAFDTLAFSKSVWPEEWFAAPQKMAVRRLFSFAFHAYRINEVIGIEGNSFCMEQYARDTIAVDQNATWPWLWDYHFALNRIRHCTSFKFGKVNPTQGQSIWKYNKNVSGGFIVVSTMQYPDEVAIPLFPLAVIYIHEVKRKIQSWG